MQVSTVKLSTLAPEWSYTDHSSASVRTIDLRVLGWAHTAHFGARRADILGA